MIEKIVDAAERSRTSGVAHLATPDFRHLLARGRRHHPALGDQRWPPEATLYDDSVASWRVAHSGGTFVRVCKTRCEDAAAIRKKALRTLAMQKAH